MQMGRANKPMPQLHKFRLLHHHSHQLQALRKLLSQGSKNPLSSHASARIMMALPMTALPHLI